MEQREIATATDSQATGSQDRAAEESRPASATGGDVVVTLPRHDESSLFREVYSTVSIAAAFGLLLWHAAQLVSSVGLSAWWLQLAVLGGMAAADLVSGLVHWTADTWGSEQMPILGRRLVHPFRVHHVNPDDFLRRRFIDTNGDVSMLAIPILLATAWVPLETWWGGMLRVFVVSFGAIGLLTNQVHQWAHMATPPRVIRVLQRCGILLSRPAHDRHHVSPYVENYCIATGWCNRPLSTIGFFRRLERVVTLLTGLQPRQDDKAFQANVESTPAARTADQGDQDA